MNGDPLKWPAVKATCDHPACPHRESATFEVVAIAAEPHTATHHALICYLHAEGKTFKMLVPVGAQVDDLIIRLAALEARRTIGLPPQTAVESPCNSTTCGDVMDGS